MLVFRDVTGRREGQEATVSLRTLIDGMADGVIACDADGKFLFWNNAATELMRMGSAEVPPQRWSAHYGVFLPDRHTPFPAYQLPLVRAIRGESVDGVEMFVRHAGHPQGVYLNASGRPLTDPDGRRVGGLVVFRDVTADKAIHEQLVISDRMASVGTLAAGVAHEINNPLAAVMGNLDVARLEAAALAERAGATAGLDDLRACLDDAHDGAQRVRLIVRDLKLFSRAQEERMVRVDLGRVLDSALRLAANEIRHRAQLHSDVGVVPWVDGNESRLCQVFLNLIVNAAQAIEEGRAQHNEIRVVTRTDPDGAAVVEIGDTGAGMTPEVIGRVFTPFFTTKPVGVGTGLGLAICQRIVAAHGGRIEIESEVGRGTTVRVWLPAGVAPAAIVAPATSTPPSPRRGRVLVVDDDPMVATVVARALRAEHEVVVTHHAEDAVELIRSGQRYDVILSDVMMPQMTGPELHAELRQLAPEQAECIIFLTGGAFTPGTSAFVDATANACIAKPFDVHELRTLVNERVAGSRRPFGALATP